MDQPPIKCETEMVEQMDWTGLLLYIRNCRRWAFSGPYETRPRYTRRLRIARTEMARRRRPQPDQQ